MRFFGKTNGFIAVITALTSCGSQEKHVAGHELCAKSIPEIGQQADGSIKQALGSSPAQARVDIARSVDACTVLMDGKSNQCRRAVKDLLDAPEPTADTERAYENQVAEAERACGADAHDMIKGIIYLHVTVPAGSGGRQGLDRSIRLVDLDKELAQLVKDID